MGAEIAHKSAKLCGAEPHTISAPRPSLDTIFVHQNISYHSHCTWGWTTTAAAHSRVTSGDLPTGLDPIVGDPKSGSTRQKHYFQLRSATSGSDVADFGDLNGPLLPHNPLDHLFKLVLRQEAPFRRQKPSIFGPETLLRNPK